MNTEKLEEIKRKIGGIERQTGSLAVKINHSKQRKLSEESLNVLLSFELSNMKEELKKAKDTVGKLMEQYNSMIETFHLKKDLLRKFEQLNEVNSHRLEIKERQMERLQHRLEHYDFALEAQDYSSTSDRSGDLLSQFPSSIV